MITATEVGASVAAMVGDGESCALASSGSVGPEVAVTSGAGDGVAVGDTVAAGGISDAEGWTVAVG
jgi:hypothetical protein